MSDTPEKEGRYQVRAANPSGACGHIEHMTIDQLRVLAVGDDFDATCPACGLFHLTQAEIEKLNSEKVTDSDHYIAMKSAAEDTP